MQSISEHLYTPQNNLDIRNSLITSVDAFRPGVETHAAVSVCKHINPMETDDSHSDSPSFAHSSGKKGVS